MLHLRPSHRELDKKIREAKNALDQGVKRFANCAKAVGELYDLDIGDADEVWNLIRQLLDEISPDHYAGGRPPQRSYERRIEQAELFAFSWDSKKMGKEMYLKFAFHKGHFYYVSLHGSRKER